MDSIIINENDLYLAGLHSIGLTHLELKHNFCDPGKDYDYKNAFLHINTLILKGNRREKIEAAKREFDIEVIRDVLIKFSIKIITIHSEMYPRMLREIYHAPYIIYVRGDEKLLSNNKTLGVIGTRKNTFYGKKILTKFIPDLTKQNYTIISGGAYGIDSLAHSITLENNGKTVSVFGTGIDNYYPAQNRNLFHTILEKNGALISCFPLGTKPESYNFPIRNEIVAGLSQGILVVEAGIKSGTLITANLGLEQGKDIFAVPGNIFDSSSDGTNMLIATGQAKCTLSSKDIIHEYEEGLHQEETLPEKNIEISFTEKEAMIIGYLQQGINTIEGISLHSNLSIQDTTSLLTMLEMKGYIELDMLNTYHIC